MSGRALGRIGPAILVLLLLAGWWLTRAMGPQDDLEWVEARRDDLVLAIDVSGSLRAKQTSMLGPPQLREYWEFKIAHMAPEGEEVAQGTPVLAFDTSDLEQKLLQQMAEREQSRKQIDRTRKNLRMNRRKDELRLAEAQARLRKARLKVAQPGELSKVVELELARLDLELAGKEVAYLEARLEASARSAEAELATLEAQRQRAEQKVDGINLALERMVRRAPREGTVIYVSDWRGDKKSIGDTCWKQEQVIEIPDLTRMEAEGRVDEADAGRLAEGQRVTLRLDAHPDVEFTGRVASIWKTVQPESWRSPLRVVRLEIALDETDVRRMRPGMRFRGRVETERDEDVVLVPLAAIFVRPDGPRVFRRTLLGHEPLRVRLGRRNETHVEVLEGLRAGDEVSVVDPRASDGET